MPAGQVEHSAGHLAWLGNAAQRNVLQGHLQDRVVLTSAEANLVSVRPGSKALQRMPNCAHSFANALVMLITAPLVIE